MMAGTKYTGTLRRPRPLATAAALACLACLAGIGAHAQSAAPAAAPAAAAAAAAAPTPPLAALILGFIAIVALIPAAAWLLRRTGLANRSSASGLRITGQLALGPRERLVIVEAGERRWLLGVGPAGITRLGTLPAAPSGSDGTADGSAAAAAAAPAGFADQLNRVTPKR
jgi:flagellar protein FliO/FliZ